MVSLIELEMISRFQWWYSRFCTGKLTVCPTVITVLDRVSTISNSWLLQRGPLPPPQNGTYPSKFQLWLFWIVFSSFFRQIFIFNISFLSFISTKVWFTFALAISVWDFGLKASNFTNTPLRFDFYQVKKVQWAPKSNSKLQLLVQKREVVLRTYFFMFFFNLAPYYSTFGLFLS